MKLNSAEKRPYKKPKLLNHGSVEQLTQQMMQQQPPSPIVGSVAPNKTQIKPPNPGNEGDRGRSSRGRG